MALIDFLKKNQRRCNILVCKSDGTELGYQRSGIFCKDGCPEFPDEEAFVTSLDFPTKKDGHCSRWHNFWKRYWPAILKAEVDRVEQDSRNNLLILYMEPDVYYYESQDRLCRTADLQEFYQEYAQETSYEDFCNYIVNGRHSFLTKLL